MIIYKNIQFTHTNLKEIYSAMKLLDVTEHKFILLAISKSSIFIKTNIPPTNYNLHCC